MNPTDNIIIPLPPLNLALVEIEARLPQVARWRTLFERVESAAHSSGLSPEAFFDHLLISYEDRQRGEKSLTLAASPVETAEVPSASEEPAPPVPMTTSTRDRILELFQVASTMYVPTMRGRGKENGSNRKWFELKHVAEILGVSESAVRNHAAILVSEGLLRTKANEFRSGRRGKRPTLYAFNPPKELVNGESHRLEDQEAARSRR